VVDNSALIEAYGFTVGSTNFVAFWGTSNVTVTLNGVTTSQVRVYDLVGNVSTPATVALSGSAMPQIVAGYNGVSLSTFTNSFYTATVAGRTDTVAPQLALATVPRAGGTLWRWFAVDDSGIPTEGAPDAIQYRYNFGSGYSEWTGDTSATDASATTIIVQARDAAGNVATASFGVEAAEDEGEEAGTGVIITGNAVLRGPVNLRIAR
jgi:hypothetical protein